MHVAGRAASEVAFSASTAARMPPGASAKGSERSPVVALSVCQKRPTPSG